MAWRQILAWDTTEHGIFMAGDRVRMRDARASARSWSHAGERFTVPVGAQGTVRVGGQYWISVVWDSVPESFGAFVVEVRNVERV